MEIPAKVSIYCPLLDAKGTAAKLLSINGDGYYHLEVNVKGRVHTVLAPIQHTALLFAEPEPELAQDFEIER
jgi:hypothetical protein